MAELRVEHNGEETAIVRPRQVGMVIAVSVATVLAVVVLRLLGDYRTAQSSNIYDRGATDVSLLAVSGLLVVFALVVIVQNFFPQRLTISGNGVELTKWGFRRVSIPWSALRALRTGHTRRYAIGLQGLAQRNYYVELAGESSRIRITTSSNAWSLDNLRVAAFTLSQHIRLNHPSITITDVEGWIK